MTRRLRVAMVAGGWPADSAYLSTLADKVDLVLHHSSWMPPGQEHGLTGPADVSSRAYRPLVRTGKGHLAFVYPGLHRELSRHCPDVVHVISEPWGLLAAQCARWVRANPDSRLVLHGCDTMWHHGSSAKRWVRRALLSHTLGAVDAFAAENSKALRMARASGLPDRARTARIHTNPRDSRTWRPPTPLERASARGVLGLTENTVAVGFVGRLVPQKGLALLIEAARLLEERGAPTRIFIAGTGPMLAELQALSAPNVDVLGPLPHPAGVRDLLHGLDVFACPSLVTPTWEDQGPRALLEAMMCGVVPVATATGGIPETLGGHGVLFEPVNGMSLVAAVDRATILARDGAVRSALAAFGESEYSIDSAVLQLIDLWKSVRGQRGPLPLGSGNHS